MRFYIFVLVACFYLLGHLSYVKTQCYNKKKLLSTYIILLATHHYLVYSLYVLSLQGKDSRSEYRTTDRKHFLALNTAAIVYLVYISFRLEVRSILYGLYEFRCVHDLQRRNIYGISTLYFLHSILNSKSKTKPEE